MRVPLPAEEKLLQSLSSLARLMSRCSTLIYKQQHTSLAPIWNAANEIRRDLLRFAEQQRKGMNFNLVGEPSTGELGVCQTMISTSKAQHTAKWTRASKLTHVSQVYHHTMILTFRPFLVLRAKLRHCEQGTASRSTRNGSLPKPPPWLDTACEYCLDATRHCISFLAGACGQNVLCRVRIQLPRAPIPPSTTSVHTFSADVSVQEIKYHAFFIEGAGHVLLLDMLRDSAAGRANLPWILSAIHTLRMMRPRSEHSPSNTVDLAENLERLARSVYPDFRAAPDDTQIGDPAAALQMPRPSASAIPGFGALPSDVSRSSTVSPDCGEQPAVPAPADGGWNFDFATTDMEAFLSIDPSWAPYQLPMYPS
jgi:hypothetical protein